MKQKTLALPITIQYASESNGICEENYQKCKFRYRIAHDKGIIRNNLRWICRWTTQSEINHWEIPSFTFHKSLNVKWHKIWSFHHLRCLFNQIITKWRWIFKYLFALFTNGNVGKTTEHFSNLRTNWSIRMNYLLRLTRNPIDVLMKIGMDGGKA